MSNTNTTRLGNPDIINIAKQRFEKRQQSKLPSIIVNLPSGGVIYPKSHPLASGQVEMRYMTAYDEDILTNISYIREGVVFEKLLESLVLTDVVISDIAELDRDGLIINARIVSYGSDYPVVVTDNKNGKQYERKVDLKKIQPKSFDLVSDDNGEFEYKTNAGDIIKFSYNLTTNDFNTVSDFLLNYIKEVNGNRNHEEIKDFIRYSFLAGDAKEFRKYVTLKAPGLNYQYEFEGEDGSTFIAPFQIGADLLWF
jgi:hypothetical protein